MIKVRQNTFETNSSSTHSLVYRADSITGNKRNKDYNSNISLYDFYGDDEKNGILALWFGEYYWEGDPCTNFRTKLAYLLTQIVGGYGFTYYTHDKDNTEIKIKTQKDWDNVIENYVMKDPKVLRVLDFIKEKSPNIKGFKFYWYNPQDSWELEQEYRLYKQEHNIKNKESIPHAMNNPFWNRYDKGKIGFGNIDHQSLGYLTGIKDLNKYLFDDNMWVIITNDNIY